MDCKPIDRAYFGAVVSLNSAAASSDRLCPEAPAWYSCSGILEEGVGDRFLVTPVNSPLAMRMVRPASWHAPLQIASQMPSTMASKYDLVKSRD